jgi:hypothetical protein
MLRFSFGKTIEPQVCLGEGAYKPHVSQSGPLFIGRLLYLSARPLIILYDARVSSSQSHLLLGFVTNLLLFTPLGGKGGSTLRGGGGWVGGEEG